MNNLSETASHFNKPSIGLCWGAY